jgi:hypothetical protein
MKRRVTKADAEMAELVANPVLTEADHRLFNGKQLVEELGVKYDFWKDMRLAGFIPPISGLTTLSYALAWLNRHTNFREDARILKLSRKPRLAVNPERQGVGKSGSLRLMRGGRRSSQRTPRILLESAA